MLYYISQTVQNLFKLDENMTSRLKNVDQTIYYTSNYQKKLTIAASRQI